jgi:hypothetical protein
MPPLAMVVRVEGAVALSTERVEGPSPARLVELLAAPTTPLAALRHVIHAHRLAGAESFTELLSLGRLVGVERHSYQLETVHRVLRTLRGRALLSDEVGLGKTIEALMVLLEYQVRGMAKRVLVIGRLHRFGQTSEVEVFNLCARGSMEERILGVLHDRVRLFELVVGEMDMVLGNLSDEADLEERLLALCAEAASESAVDRGLTALGDELLRARGRYDEVRELDQALFGKEFET